MLKNCHTIIQLIIAFAVTVLSGSAVCDAATKKTDLPDYLGVFAISNGKLIELKKHPQSLGVGMGGIGGMDLLRSLSGIQFPNGKVQFIIYSQNPVSSASLYRVATVRKQVTYSFGSNNIEKVEDLGSGHWTVLNGAVTLRISPVPENPAMMVRCLLAEDLPPGTYALKIGDGIYDFTIAGKTNADEWCADRIIQMMNVGYLPCGDSDREIARVNKEIAIKKEGDEQAKRQRAELEARLAKGKEERETALLDAAKNGNYNIVKDLLTLGVSVSGSGTRGSPLGWACKDGYKEIVELLISHGANVNENNGGVTPGQSH